MAEAITLTTSTILETRVTRIGPVEAAKEAEEISEIRIIFMIKTTPKITPNTPMEEARIEGEAPDIKTFSGSTKIQGPQTGKTTNKTKIKTPPKSKIPTTKITIMKMIYKEIKAIVVVIVLEISIAIMLIEEGEEEKGEGVGKVPRPV